MAINGPKPPGKVCGGRIPGILSFSPPTRRQRRPGATSSGSPQPSVSSANRQPPFTGLSEKLKFPKVGEASLLEAAWRQLPRLNPATRQRCKALPENLRLLWRLHKARPRGRVDYMALHHMSLSGTVLSLDVARVLTCSLKFSTWCNQECCGRQQ